MILALGAGEHNNLSEMILPVAVVRNRKSELWGVRAYRCEEILPESAERFD